MHDSYLSWAKNKITDKILLKYMLYSNFKR